MWLYDRIHKHNFCYAMQIKIMTLIEEYKLNLKKWIYRIISLPFFAIGILGTVDTLLNLTNPAVILPWKSLIYTFIIISILFGFGYIFLCLSMNSINVNKITATFTKFIFVFYLITMLTVMYGDATFVRNKGYSISWKDYLHSVNLIPFKTIFGYLIGLTNNTNRDIALANLIGNILAFAPMGFFLPTLYRKLRKFLIFFIIMLVILILIELIQLLTMLGICDIDDVILNIVGALIVWKFCNMFGYSKFFKGTFE